MEKYRFQVLRVMLGALVLAMGLFGTPTVFSADLGKEKPTNLNSLLDRFGYASTRSMLHRTKGVALYRGLPKMQEAMQGQTNGGDFVLTDFGLLEAPGIRFDLGKYDLSKSTLGYLEVLAERFKGYNANQKHVEIVGHICDIDTDEKNMPLSELRARAVVAKLIELGVSEQLLLGRGEGENYPLIPNDTDEGQSINRRVSFQLKWVKKLQ